MGLLEGKVAVVTGAGRPRGIGEATAIKLAEEGADVVISDIDRTYQDDLSWYPLGNMDHLQIVAGKIRDLGRKALVLRVDITRKEEVQEMIDSTIREFGKLDILVNNAGAAVGAGPFLSVDEAAWQKTIDVNVMGTFYCMRAAIPEMLRLGGGRIINISSVGGLKGAPQYGAYNASKFAVVGMTQTAAFEFAPYNILINCVCPGSVDTKLTEFHRDAYAQVLDVPAEELKKQQTKRIAMGRWAVGEDIANAVCFLASPLNTYITAQALPVEGGYLPPWVDEF